MIRLNATLESPPSLNASYQPAMKYRKDRTRYHGIRATDALIGWKEYASYALATQGFKSLGITRAFYILEVFLPRGRVDIDNIMKATGDAVQKALGVTDYWCSAPMPIKQLGGPKDSPIELRLSLWPLDHLPASRVHQEFDRLADRLQQLTRQAVDSLVSETGSAPAP